MSLRIDGIDLSNAQKAAINWPEAKKAGVRLVMHKATEGHTYVDPLYARRRAETTTHGIKFGAYHFAHPAPGNAVTEAEFFLKHAAPKRGDIVPALDLEVNEHGMGTTELSDWTHQWISHVRGRLGIKRALLYTRYNLEGKYAAKLWVPSYSNANTPPKVPAPFSGWSMWQFSDGTYGDPKRVPGVSFPVDINTLAGGPIRRGLLLRSITI